MTSKKLLPTDQITITFTEKETFALLQSAKYQVEKSNEEWQPTWQTIKTKLIEARQQAKEELNEELPF